MTLRRVSLISIAAVTAACSGSNGILPLGDRENDTGDQDAAGNTMNDAAASGAPSSGADAQGGPDASGSLADASGDGPSSGGGSPDSSTVDAAPSGPCVAASATATVYVDHASGTDDRSHGGGTGACAYKTLTYALTATQGSARSIDLASGTYSEATGETLPFVLTGRQALYCAQATLEGEGPWLPAGSNQTTEATVIVDGTSNTLDHCKIIGDKALDADGNCVVVATDGLAAAPHDIEGSDIQQCGNVALAIVGTQVTVGDTSLYDSNNGLEWFGNDPTGKMVDDWFSNQSTDITCDNSDPNVSGMSNANGGGDFCENCQNCGSF